MFLLILGKESLEAKYTLNIVIFHRLVICSNNIAGDGLCAVAKAMRSNGALHAVYIWGNKLEEPACRVSAMYI